MTKGQSYSIGADVFFNIVEHYVPQHSVVMNRHDSEVKHYINLERAAGTKVCGMPELKTSLMTLKHFSGPLNCAFLKVEIVTSGGFQTTHLFPADQDRVFTLGRAHECDIVIPQYTISREQCRLIFERGSWYIRDGGVERESANGTWLSLTDYRLRHLKQPSEPFALDQGQQLKVSDTILQVDWSPDCLI